LAKFAGGTLIMYTGAGHSAWEIGDVDVFIHDGVYHLFHLIIPNHDYIAHAVSTDGISWRRVDNALFVGHPGAWDDDMLWTMHVTRNRGRFEMLYTGLRRSDRGRLHGIGMAVSDDLLTWEKVIPHGWPLYPDGRHYETIEDCARGWTSFRDPYRFEWDGGQYMLFSARALNGPVSRRGCVGIARETPGGYEQLPTLHYPRMYDDVECPCLFDLNGRLYLIGSIREDVKVRYWVADGLFEPFRSFHSDVLLPQGNYAGRVVRDGDHRLLYTFYYADRAVNSLRVLPPPKEIDTDSDGRLILRSYYRWAEKVRSVVHQPEFTHPKGLLGNRRATMTIEPNRWTFSSASEYELFAFRKPAQSLIWEGTLTLEGLGKCGLLMDCDEEGNGYYFPFDFVSGLVRVRRWGFNPNDTRNNFVYDNLQSAQFKPSPTNTLRFRLVWYGNYIELSIDGIVVLTLIDYRFQGELMGIYSASSLIVLRDSHIEVLQQPVDEYGSQEPVLGPE
jgi:beta-fructofuranosidase